MATVTKSIGATARDYSTITLWEADLDNTGVYSSGDDAVGECYADAVFNESVTINGGGTVGLNSIKLCAASGEGHEGYDPNDPTAAVTIDRNSASGRIIIISGSITTTIEDLIIKNSQATQWNQRAHGVESSCTTDVYLRRLIINDIGETTSSYGARGIYKAQTTHNLYVLNCTIYNIYCQAGSGDSQGISTYDNCQNLYVYNTTIHDVTGYDAVGIKLVGGHAGGKYYAKNCCITDCDTSCFGTNYHSTNDYNLSSDATADDPGNGNDLINQLASNQYKSDSAPYDLRLASGADAIGAGTDLGTSPTGVEIDIAGRNRDDAGDTWDIGSNQYVATGNTQTATLSPLEASWSVVDPTAQFNLEATLSPLEASWSVVDPTVQFNLEATVAPLEASWSVVDPTVQFNLEATVAPLEASWSVVDPAATITVEAAVDSLEATWSVVDPTATTGATETASVAPTSLSWSVVDPTAQFNLEATLSPLEASWAINDPTAKYNLEAGVNPLAASWSVIDPTATFVQPIYTVEVAPLSATWLAISPVGTAIFARTLIEDLRTYLLNSGVLDDGIGVIEQNKSTLPEDLPASRIVIRRRSHNRDLNLDGEALLDYTDLDIECVSEDIDEALSLAQVVKNYLHGMKGTMGSFCILMMSVEDHTDSYEPFSLNADEGSHVAALDVTVIHTDSPIIAWTLARPTAGDTLPSTSIGEDLRSYLITCDLLDDSSGLGIIEQNKSTLPEDLPAKRIVFTRRRNNTEFFLGGGDSIREIYFDLECISEDLDEAIELAHSVKNVLHAHKGCMGGWNIGACFVRSHSDDYRPFNLSEDDSAYVAALNVQFIYTPSNTRAFTLARPVEQTEEETSVVEDLRTFLIAQDALLDVLPDAADLGVVAQQHSPLPEDPPATRIVITRRYYERETFLGGGDALANTDIDLEIIGEDLDEVIKITNALRTILHGYKGEFGNTCGVIFIEDQEDDYNSYALSEDEGVHTATLDLRIIH